MPAHPRSTFQCRVTVEQILKDKGWKHHLFLGKKRWICRMSSQSRSCPYELLFSYSRFLAFHSMCLVVVFSWNSLISYLRREKYIKTPLPKSQSFYACPVVTVSWQYYTTSNRIRYYRKDTTLGNRTSHIHYKEDFVSQKEPSESDVSWSSPSLTLINKPTHWTGRFHILSRLHG